MENPTDKQNGPTALADAPCSAVLWSQAFVADDRYHAIPTDDHDPRATGWIAKCGAFCTGEPIPTDEAGDCEACPKCLRMVYPPNAGTQRPGTSDAEPATRTPMPGSLE